MKNQFKKLGLKKIKNFPKYYCNKQGDIYSTRFDKLRQLTPVLTPTTNYMQVTLTNKEGSHILKWHRVIAMTWCKGKTRWKKEVHHIDHNRTNNKASNLMWVTSKENSEFTARLYVNTDLNEDMIHKIRCASALGLTSKEIIKLFGLPLSNSSVANISTDRSFKHNDLKREEFKTYLEKNPHERLQ